MISVIIAVYEHADVLRLVLESLLRQSKKDFETVIADDGSSEAVASVVREYSGKFFMPISHVWHEDKGFRKTIIANKAVRAAKGDYLIFIDGDCLLHHRFVEIHARYARKGALLSGRRVMFGEELSKSITVQTITSGVFEKQSFWFDGCDPESRSRGKFIPGSFFLGNLRNKTYDILGCNFSLHKSDFIAVNGYDEQIIGRGLEDCNLNRRLKISGIKGYSVTRLALQYHIYHKFDPVPHSGEMAFRYNNPTDPRAEIGYDSHSEEVTA